MVRLISALGALAVGGLLTVHMGMNSLTGTLSGNRVMANAVFWLSGFVMAAVSAAFHWDGGFFRQLSQVPPVLLAAGALGAGIAFFISWSIPVLGMAAVTFLLLIGQMAMSAWFSHRGYLGTPVEAIDGAKVLGLAVMILGAGVYFFGGRIFRRF